MDDFKRIFDAKKQEVEEVLKRFAPVMEGEKRLIAEAINYSFLASGKRIRPLIIKEIYDLFGGRKEELLHPFMAAVEMIHTYSLIHDDLPAMDNDDFRRGRPTNHNVYGEALAILAGDALLNLAYESAIKAFEACESMEEVHRVVEAFRILSFQAGIFGMVTGQVMDMELSTKQKTSEKLEKMYTLKTGALLRACFMIGAVLAGGSEEAVFEMKETGEAIGLAFQLKDDMLDIKGDEKLTGKSSDSDAKNDKLTYYVMLGSEKADALISDLTKKAKDHLKKWMNEGKAYDGFILQLIEYLENRDR